MFADVVYDQPASFPTGPACACWTSSYGSDVSGGYQTFDNFQLTTAATIGAVDWQGLYWDFINHGNNPVSPNTTDWQVQFWSDGGGLPASLLYSQTLPAASVSTTFVGDTNDLGDPTHVYAFHAALPLNFSASAGTMYWFSVLSNQATFDPIFSWTLGTGGDGVTQQELLGTFGSGFTTQPGDRAFTLESAVPEPASFVFLATALIGAGIVKRQRRQI